MTFPFVIKYKLVQAILFCCALSAAISQEDPAVSIEPQYPAVGAEFAIRVTVPGAASGTVTAPEPAVGDGLRLSGIDVRPVAEGELQRTLVIFRFIAMKPGKWDVSDLRIEVAGKKKTLGTWTVEVTEPAGIAPRPKTGAWISPSSVWQYEPFVVRCISEDGSPIALSALPRIEGVGADFLLDTAGFIVSATRDFTLPQLALQEKNGPLTIVSKKIIVRRLPPGAEDVFGVGLFTARMEAAKIRFEAGDFVPFSIRVEGNGVPVSPLIPAPRLAWTPFSGSGASESTMAAAELPVSSESQPLVELSVRKDRWFCAVTARGGFLAAKEGQYLITIASIACFDPVRGVVVRSQARELKITVEPKARRTVTMDGRLTSWLDGELASLCRKDPAWEKSLRLFRAGDFKESANLVPAAGTHPARRDAGEDTARAALLLFAGSTAKAYFSLLPLERALWPNPVSSRLLDLAGPALGLSGRPASLLPPPGPFFAAAAIAFAAALPPLAWFAFIGIRRRRLSPRPGRIARPLAGCLLAVAVACIIGGFLSLAERGRPQFAAKGSIVRVVPSKTATASFAAPEGSCGRVARVASPWFLAEFQDGRSGWLLEQDVIFY